MADRNAGECRASLHSLKFQTRADPTERFATKEDPGRGDLIAVRAGRGVYVEIKCGEDSFDLRNWRPNQRAWALEWAIGTGTDYYIWLRMGTQDPRVSVDKPLRKRTWLVPYHPMIQIVGLVESLQFALPYRTTKNHTLAMRERQYDAVTLFADYELSWAGDGRWSIPETHVFHQAYIAQPSLGMVQATHFTREIAI